MGSVNTRNLLARMERHQIGLYLLAIVAGIAIGFLAPGSVGALKHSIYPVLGLLLYATFLGIPFASTGAAVRDLRFLMTVLALNFVVVPAVVFGLTRFVAGDLALVVGVMLVLLTPCIDYVIVFTGLAGGASDRLLAAAPVLMLLPLALALPGPLALAALVVVTQTLVELIGMVLYVRFLPLVVPKEPTRQRA